MSTVNLGRVQGGGIFYSTASSGTSIAKSTLSPTGLVPLVGDCVMFPNGDLRKITAVDSTNITCGSIVASFKGNIGAAGLGALTISNVVTVTTPSVNVSVTFNISNFNRTPVVGDEFIAVGQVLNATNDSYLLTFEITTVQAPYCSATIKGLVKTNASGGGDALYNHNITVRRYGVCFHFSIVVSDPNPVTMASTLVGMLAVSGYNSQGDSYNIKAATGLITNDGSVELLVSGIQANMLDNFLYAFGTEIGDTTSYHEWEEIHIDDGETQEIIDVVEPAN